MSAALLALGVAAIAAASSRSAEPRRLGGGEIAPDLPPRPGPEREAFLLAAARSGHLLVDWSSVVSVARGRRCVLPVTRRALALGTPEDRLLFSTTYLTAQALADDLACVLMTPKVADLVHAQATVSLKPMPQAAWVEDGTMGDSDRMVAYSAMVEAAAAARGVTSECLVWNEGKAWVLTRRNWIDPDIAKRANGANYGWHDTRAPNGKCWQGTGLMHNMDHVDYSQVVTLMGAECWLDGTLTSTEAILRDPDLWELLSDEGPLPAARHPRLATPNS